MAARIYRDAYTTEEIFGEPAAEWDRFAMATRIADTARRAYDRLSEESRAFVAAFVAGLNAGLHADAPELAELGIQPQPWPEWMPLAVFHAQHILFAGLGGLLWARRARRGLRGDAPPPPHQGARA